MWDKQLCAYGTKLAEERKSFIEDLNLKAEKIHGDISANKESLKIEYKESVDYSNFYEKMVKNRDKDIFMEIPVLVYIKMIWFLYKRQ